jgi:hypothetical protein
MEGGAADERVRRQHGGWQATAALNGRKRSANGERSMNFVFDQRSVRVSVAVMAIPLNSM